MTSTIRVGALAFVGLILLQSAWILALPPFHGIDEFDHVYRAAGVAEGQWRLTTPAQGARGRLVTVPRGLVEAASPQCDALPYTDPANCYPTDEVAPGIVTVPTAADSYNPVYYAVIGVPARVFAGASVDYAMRIVSAALCAIGIAVSIGALHGTRAGPWMRFGLLVGLTPVLVYSTILPAPNAIEMVAALCLWTALLSLDRTDPGLRVRRLLLAVATGGASILALVRLLGPMWLGLIVIAVAGVLGLRRIVTLVRRDLLGCLVATATVLAATGLGIWWTLNAGLTGPSEEPVPSDPLGVDTWVAQVVVWTAQTVGAFPFRDQPAPIGVYGLYFLVVVPFVAVGIVRSHGRRRVALVLLILAAAALPLFVTLLTFSEQGVIWQGRYGLPLIVGIPIVAGMMVDRGESFAPRARLLRVMGVVMLGGAHVWSVVSVLASESQRAAYVFSEVWVRVPAGLLAVIAAVGFSGLAYAVWLPSAAQSSQQGASPGRSTPSSKKGHRSVDAQG